MADVSTLAREWLDGFKGDRPDATFALVSDLEAKITSLRALVYSLSDALTDEGPDWSDLGLDTLRRQAARELPHVEWLQPYLAEDIADDEAANG